MSELSDQEKEVLHDALVALRAEIAWMLSSSAEAAAPVDLGEPIGRLSRVDAIQQQNVTAANRRAAQARMNLVDTALASLDDDEYGDCRDCGGPIDARRLAARPETPFCITCQSTLEQRR